MLKVAIIGCGKIADLHVQQILRIPDAKVVAVCDREPLMASQLRDRFSISKDYQDPEELLEKEKPDVVHITTSPESHLPLGQLCLEAGSHIYVEKPFALDFNESKQLINAAKEARKMVTVGHNVQFTRPARLMRRMIADGFLGSRPIHMESSYGYDLGDARYVLALLGDRNHWVRQLPGRLLQNIISHGISKMAEFIPGDDPQVITLAFQSSALRQANVEDMQDELRVIVFDRASGVTAYFTFSTQTRPLLHQFRVFGAENGLIVDDDHLVVLKLKGRRHKSYLEQFIPPVTMAGQYLSNGVVNIGQFLRRELHNDLGMKNLIQELYSAIVSNAPPPIPYREILLTARIMDKIFAQVFSEKLEAQAKHDGAHPF